MDDNQIFAPKLVLTSMKIDRKTAGKASFIIFVILAKHPLIALVRNLPIK